jgi:hypothetical protein
MPHQPATMEKHEFERLSFNERIDFNKREGLFLGEFRYLSFDISLYRTKKFYIEIWKFPNEQEIAHIETIHTDVRLDIYMKAISDLKVISSLGSPSLSIK